MIGQLPGGGYATSHTAAYPPGMCLFLARHIYDDFMKHNPRARSQPFGGGRLRQALTPGPTSSTSEPKAGATPTVPWLSTSHEVDTISLQEIQIGPALVSQEEIDRATRLMDSKGVDRPIREGLDKTVVPDLSEDEHAQGPSATSANTGDSTSEEERELPGTVRPKKGAGWWGRGPPLRPQRKGLEKVFVDGAGFPSPGRWKPDQRKLPNDSIAKELRSIFEAGLKEAIPKLPGGELKAAVLELAAGRVESSPFPEAVVEKVRLDLRLALRKAGFGDGLPQPNDLAQQTEVRLLQALLHAFRDPDHYFGEWWARGVWLGAPERKLPRTPALYERKSKWALGAGDPALHGEWRVNYSSLADHEQKVLAQYSAEIEEGLMQRTTLGKALAVYGDTLIIAATGAIAKKGQGPDGEVRVIFDGTRGIFLNHGIRIRDQVRFPTAADIKAVLAEMAEEGGTHFMLVYDVKKAHRRVPVLPSEWGRQACQVKGSAAATLQAKRSKASSVPSGDSSTSRAIQPAPARVSRADFTEAELAEDVFLNCVGTFGISSAGYWWGRAGGAIIRLTHYVLGYDNMLWALLYSDDGKLTGRGRFPERALLLHLFVIVVIGLPMSWKKIKGGFETEWIGYWVDAARFELGISANRAAWAIRWLTDKSTEGKARLGEIREVLGRLQFIAGPVEFIRPFLGPLYQWCMSGPKFALPKLPVMLVLIMRFLAEELKRAHTMPCERRAMHLGEVFRMDAKAEGDTVVVGGWRTLGSERTTDAAWFSLQLTRSTAPWAFARGEPFRVVASLELLGTLIGLMVLVPEGEAFRAETAASFVLSCGTDNQGNSYLLDRMMTTKYPLGLILMEIAAQMRTRRLILRARWLPRLENEEADALTNLDFRHFDPAKRIEVSLDKLGFKVLPLLFEVGEQYLTDLEAARERGKAAKLSAGPGAQCGEKKRHKAGDKLRDRDAW